jgi:hypothetical protein
MLMSSMTVGIGTRPSPMAKAMQKPPHRNVRHRDTHTSCRGRAQWVGRNPAIWRSRKVAALIELKALSKLDMAAASRAARKRPRKPVGSDSRTNHGTRPLGS